MVSFVIYLDKRTKTEVIGAGRCNADRLLWRPWQQALDDQNWCEYQCRHHDECLYYSWKKGDCRLFGKGSCGSRKDDSFKTVRVFEGKQFRYHSIGI